MTLFNVTDIIDLSEEGLVQSYSNLKDFFEKAKKDPERYHTNGTTLPSYETYRDKCLSRRDSFDFFHKKNLWDAWNSQEHFLNPTYRLFARTLGGEELGIFINVPHMRHILKKYKAEFCQITGSEFDVETILDSLEDDSSPFWNQALTDHFLLGLLLGYGEKNAYFFDWTRKNHLSLESVSMLRFPELSRSDKHTKQAMKKTVTIDDLVIPYFVSFEIHDKEIERYSKERERIINFLKEKDFITFVINCLETKADCL